MKDKFFKKAVPVWQQGKENELHTRCVFFATFEGKDSATLMITASNIYRVFVNGNMVGAGPARSAHDRFRVDELPLKNLKEKNVIFIEAVAYNSYNYCHLYQSAFLCAEVVRNASPILWTGRDFIVREYIEKKRQVCKLSYQRPFTEVYAFERSPQDTYMDFSADGKAVAKEYPVQVGDKFFEERNVSYPSYEFFKGKQMETGECFIEKSLSQPNEWILKERLRIFPKKDWESDASFSYLQRLIYKKKPLGTTVGAGEYILYNFDFALTGFLKFECTTIEDSVVLVYFDEIDLNTDKEKPADIRSDRMGSVNVIEYRLKAGKTYSHTTIEPYTAKYIKVVVQTGKIENLSVGVHTYENPDAEGFVFLSENKKLNTIVEAARRTFKQNALDILTDCPSRERAGWLCDSYFSGKAEQLFTGKNKVEYNFLKNYTYAKAKGIPEDLVPMCYPADFTDGSYIPNWAFFYIFEQYDYYVRTNDDTILKESKDKVLRILKFFDRYLNEQGLLENLENWVFIEWSKANDDEYTKGVNYPSNMLYAMALECTAKMYGIEKYHQSAEKIKGIIRRDSFNGEFFEDNRVREKGELVLKGHCSETCQYYAFFTGTATRESYPRLYENLIKNFGAKREQEKMYPQVHKSNAFIGNYLRLIMLTENGEKYRIAEECEDYFYYMAEATGTLWEKDSPYASLNHGFASYAGNLLVDYLTGYKGRHGKKLLFSKPAVDMDCTLRLPLDHGFLSIERKGGKTVREYPEGYTIDEI